MSYIKIKSEARISRIFPIFLEKLIHEHKVFRASFDSLFRLAEEERSQPALRALEILCHDFLSNFHEAREELLIFPYLRKDPRHQAGGPECLLHFDLYLANRPLTRAAKACETVGIQASEAEWVRGTEEDKKNNSPLCIPYEDHEAGRIIMRAIQSLPVGAGDCEIFDKKLKLFEAYDAIQRPHCKREEGCFFFMCRDLISKEQWDTIETNDQAWLPPTEEDNKDGDKALSLLKDTMTAAGWTF